MDLEKTKDRITEAETFLVRQVARTAPWLAPFPTAYVVYRSTMEHLDWPNPVAIAAGLVIEGLGLSTAFLAVTFRAYNQTKWKKHPKAPTVLATALVGVYLTVVIVLTVVLDLEAGESGWATFAVGIFPFLSLCGMTVVALQNDHEQRIAAAAKDKAKRKPRKKPTTEPALSQREVTLAESPATELTPPQEETEPEAEPAESLEPEPNFAQKERAVADGCELCWCGMEIQAKPQAKSAHGRRHANDVRRILATGSGATLQTVAMELETLYGQQPPDEELRRLYNKYRTDF